MQVDSRLNGDGTGMFLTPNPALHASCCEKTIQSVICHVHQSRILDELHECCDRDSLGAVTPEIEQVSVAAGQWPSRVLIHAGKALGIGTGVEGFVILGVFGVIWALYYISSRDLGDGRGQGDDSGLSL